MCDLKLLVPLGPVLWPAERCAAVGVCIGVSCIPQHTSAYVSIRQHTSAHVSIRQHTSAYVSIRERCAFVRVCRVVTKIVESPGHSLDILVPV